MSYQIWSEKYKCMILPDDKMRMHIESQREFYSIIYIIN
jgi:hypothetical protein